ncbi:hypothetical protein EWH08_16410 [Sphingobium indicum]|uniref:Uncharacterized protein n=2 Tax=Sphingobium indicum TaxID=332055 RepID=A0A1L5BTC9_SPHIB|nr:DUF4286 family protein [Sphingobium indicum]APL96111.1 hypothetical protein SIDU_17205 [Sphingobium indicum B90A]KEY99544.1 hypothetical protein AI27_02795 [Sphingomonas sp. BHC-A]NYI24118.1 hypothetical protein [Sphingobium indicum]RYL99168.1 hypothetical protein EWH08_16410 [Sphingobium indicum]
MSAEAIHLLIAAETPRPVAGETALTGRARVGSGGGEDAPVTRMLLSPHPIAAPPVEGEIRWSGARVACVGLVEIANATALLCNFLEVADEAEEEFNAWYDTEHLPRLGALPGVSGIARYRSEGSPRYLALFTLAGSDIPAGDAWRTAARTPWTARIKRFTRGYRSFLFTPAPL